MNNFKPNTKGQAELILKTAGGAAAKTAIHAAFVNYKEIAKEQGDASLGAVAYDLKKSKFGMQIFDSFTFNCTSANPTIYTASPEFGGVNVVISAPFTFETALIEVNQSKNIVKTSISGMNGTVKEYMSDGDFIINLKGVIVGEVANQRPDVFYLDKFMEYLRAPLALPVTCTFLNEFNINNVVIESYKYGQREGARNIIDIEINMISDTAIVLSTSSEQKDIFSKRVPYVQKSMF
jgi:hypothetical protein